MSIVGYSTLEVIPSVKGFRGQLEKQTSGDFAAAGKRGGAQFGDAAGREAGSRFSRGLKSSLAPAAGLLAGAGVVALFKDVVGAASAAEQATGGVAAVFKDYADTVIEDSKKAADGLGLSATAYQELITLSGALLKNKGISDFADQAKGLIDIGADLAAQYGGSTRQAVEALNSALRGESDPIEKYAISLNDAAVQSVLAANGQKELTGAALEQAKTQARLTLITQQSADAQGANAREAETFAGSSARLTANLEDMKVELGSKVLPVLADFVGFLKNDGLPALEGAGGVIAGAAKAFDGLPTPIKAATAALVAFKIAQATGAGAALGGGLSSLNSGLDSTRVRAMLAADAYRNLRTGQLEIVNNSAKFTPAVGRMTASLGALRVAGSGAGAGLRRGLGNAVGLVGGPWGAAFIAGTAIVAKFWQEQQKAKQRVEEFTATLDKQTGALTESSRELAAKTLLDSGALKIAKDLGINLETVTDAALGQKDALAALNAELAQYVPSQMAVSSAGRGFAGAIGEQGIRADKLSGAIESLNGTVDKSRNKQGLLSEALGKSSSDADKSAASTSGYSTALNNAVTAVQKLLDKENERRNANLAARRDALGLAQALADARKEAGEGEKTLNRNKQAGRDNEAALIDLADQWNNSAASVKNAEGAYDKIRNSFLTIATQMGATKDQAKALADQLLGIPKKNAYQVSTPGMKKALEDAKRLRELMLPGAQIGYTNRAEREDRRRGFATGGLIGGRGSGTSDSNLIWASRGEFMQRKAAVDYYGTDFMRKINNLQLPRFAGGGQVGGGSVTAPVMGSEIRGTLRLDRDGVAYIEGVAMSAVGAGSAGARQAELMSATDGIQR